MFPDYLSVCKPNVIKSTFKHKCLFFSQRKTTVSVSEFCILNEAKLLPETRRVDNVLAKELFLGPVHMEKVSPALSRFTEENRSAEIPCHMA